MKVNEVSQSPTTAQQVTSPKIMDSSHTSLLQSGNHEDTIPPARPSPLTKSH